MQNTIVNRSCNTYFPIRPLRSPLLFLFSVPISCFLFPLFSFSNFFSLLQYFSPREKNSIQLAKIAGRAIHSQFHPQHVAESRQHPAPSSLTQASIAELRGESPQSAANLRREERREGETLDVLAGNKRTPERTKSSILYSFFQHLRQRATSSD